MELESLAISTLAHPTLACSVSSRLPGSNSRIVTGSNQSTSSGMVCPWASSKNPFKGRWWFRLYWIIQTSQLFVVKKQEHLRQTSLKITSREAQVLGASHPAYRNHHQSIRYQSSRFFADFVPATKSPDGHPSDSTSLSAHPLALFFRISSLTKALLAEIQNEELNSHPSRVCGFSSAWGRSYSGYPQQPCSLDHSKTVFERRHVGAFLMLAHLVSEIVRNQTWFENRRRTNKRATTRVPLRTRLLLSAAPLKEVGSGDSMSIGLPDLNAVVGKEAI